MSAFVTVMPIDAAFCVELGLLDEKREHLSRTA